MAKGFLNVMAYCEKEEIVLKAMSQKIVNLEDMVGFNLRFNKNVPREIALDFRIRNREKINNYKDVDLKIPSLETKEEIVNKLVCNILGMHKVNIHGVSKYYTNGNLKLEQIPMSIEVAIKNSPIVKRQSVISNQKFRETVIELKEKELKKIENLANSLLF